MTGSEIETGNVVGRGIMIVTETAVWTTLAIGMTAARTTDDLRHPAIDVTSPGTLPFVDMIPRRQRGHSRRTVVTNETLSLARHRPSRPDPVTVLESHRSDLNMHVTEVSN